MDSLDNYIDTATGKITQILQHACVVQADIHVEHFQHSQSHGTLHRDGVDLGAGNEGTKVYAIGSLTKLLIAVLLSVIVDELSHSNKPENEVYRDLRRSGRDPWETHFTILFNDFSEQKMASIPRNPTLRNVLIHFNSLPPMNFILLAPDGTSLMSISEFIEVAPRLAGSAHETTGDNYIEYSNGNYILLGLLINAIAPKYTLQELMKKHIFDPLEMTHTFMSSTDLGDLLYERPHVASANGIREIADPPHYSARAIVSPAMAAWSCTRDLAILFREFSHVNNSEESLLTRESLKRLLKPDGILNETDPKSCRQTPCGIYTALSSSTPGSKSVNRLMTPAKICSTYRLGLRKKNTEVEAYYMAGAVHGYASCFYFVPTRKVFVIVLTNTSGLTDASDHISRYILQDILKLKRTPALLRTLAVWLLEKTLDRHTSDLLPKVDIPRMALLAAQEGEKILKKWESEDTQDDRPNTKPLQLQGIYRNELTRQLIAIRLDNTRLIVNIQGAADSSKDIGLHRTGNLTFRLYPPGPEGFTIDRHDPYGWRDLTFSVDVEKDDNGNWRAATIVRHGVIPISMRKYQRLSP